MQSILSQDFHFSQIIYLLLFIIIYFTYFGTHSFGWGCVVERRGHLVDGHVVRARCHVLRGRRRVCVFVKVPC